MIDGTTGLPELPEGQYWRVLEYDLDNFDGAWTLRIEEAAPDPHWTEWRHDNFPSLEIWRGEEKRTITTGRTWYGKRIVEHQVRELTKPKPRVIWRTEIKHKTPYPGPENIRCAADRILDELAQYQAAQKLIGKYPPNKLEAP